MTLIAGIFLKVGIFLGVSFLLLMLIGLFSGTWFPIDKERYVREMDNEKIRNDFVKYLRVFFLTLKYRFDIFLCAIFFSAILFIAASALMR